MNYLAEIVAWNRWKEVNQPPATVIALWHEIMAVWNRCGWLDEFKVPNGLLQIGAGLSRKEFDNARQWLIREGRIVYKKSNRVNQAGTYKVIPIPQNGKQKGQPEGDREGDRTEHTENENSQEKPCNNPDCSKGATNGTQGGQRTAHTGGNERSTGGTTQGEHNINETKLKKTKTSTDEKNPSVKVLIDYYHDGFVKKFGEKPVISGAKDGNMFKKLLESYPEEKIKAWIDAFFVSQDPFILQSGYTLGVFYSQINKFLATKKSATGGGKYAGIVHKNG